MLIFLLLTLILQGNIPMISIGYH